MANEVDIDGLPERDSTQHRVARNAGIYLVTQLVSWVVAFAGVSIIPLTLGERAMGELLLSGVTVSNISTLFALSLETYLIREIGRDIRQTERLLRATLGLRLALIPIMVIVTFAALHAIHATPRVFAYGLLTLGATLLNLLADPLRSALAGWERAREVSITDLIGSAAPVLAIPFLFFGPRSILLAACFATGAILLLRFVWLRRVIRMRPTIDPVLWLQLIRGGLPFLLNNYAVVLYGSLTVFVLRHFADDSVLGQSGQAGKLIGTFMFVPTVVNAALLPALSRSAEGDPATFKRTQLRILTVITICALPVTAGVMLLAGPFCHLLYKPGQFLLVPVGLQYTALAILPLYIVSTMYQFLVVQNRNAIWAIILLATAALCAALQWLLIPLTIRTLHNAIAGSSLAWAISEGAASVAAFVLLRTNPLVPEYLNRIARGLMATLGMSATIWLSREWITQLHLPAMTARILTVVVPATSGSIAFLVLVLLLRALPPQEQNLIIETVRRKMRRRSCHKEA